VLRVFDLSGTFLAELDAYESLIWTRRWHRPGQFELQINRHTHGADALLLGHVVVLGNDPARAGIIAHREISLDERGKGSEMWEVRGTSLAGILTRRIVVPPAGCGHDSISDSPAETVMHHYVKAQAVEPENPARAIPLLALGADKGRGSTLSWRSRYKNLVEELEAISIASGLGWNVLLTLEPWGWVFEVFEGQDLTAGQVDNPPIIFSPDFDTLRSQRYAESEVNYRNVAYVAGQGELEGREIEIVGDGEGLDRLEAFVDARDVDLGNTSLLQARGKQYLAEMNTSRLLEAEVLTKGPFEYGKDWDLGDIVTVQNRDWGVTMDARIVEVREIYEPGGFRLEVEFGTGWPTLLSELRREIRQFGLVLRR